MIKNLFKNYIYPIAMLSGTIIGVGLFALPYIASKVGIWVMLLYFLILGGIVILIHQFFGELSLKTPDFKRLPGFAKIYLGKPGEIIAYVSTIIGLLGALLAYLIVGGEFLSALFNPIFGGYNFHYTFIYFAIGSIIIYLGIKAISKVEFWGLVGFFLILFTIFIKAYPYINLTNIINLPLKSGFANFFLPYGAVLFSLWGASLIPEVEEMLKNKKNLVKTIIPFSILVPIFVYLFFIFLVVGITGTQTTQSALVGLKGVLGNGVVNLGLFFGVLTTFTSFIALGLTLKKVLWYDLKLNKKHAWVITCFIPMILFMLGIQQFLPLVSFLGAVMIGIDGILILMMYKKIRPSRKFLIYSLLVIFLTGIIFEIITIIK